MSGSPGGHIRAADMLQVIDRDPHFELPTYPRFAAGLVTVPLENGLLVDGGSEPQVFRGKAATDLLPRLIPLLTGAHTAENLATVVGIALPAVRSALAVLYAAGTLEDAPPTDPGPPPGFNPALLRYLGRHVDSTRIHPNGEAAARTLAGTAITVAAPAEPGRTLVNVLRESGMVARLCSNGADPTGDAALVVGLSFNGAGPDLDLLDLRCRAAGVPWVRIAVGGAGLELGPRFDGTYTACHACFRQSHEVADQPLWTEPPGWAALAATELVNLLARIGSTVSVFGVTCIDLDGGTAVSYPLVRRPGCSQCGPAMDEDPAGYPLAYTYDQAVAFPPRELTDPRTHQNHYRLANLALQRATKTYAYAPSEPLPEVSLPDICDTSELSTTKASLVERITAVLLACAGLKSEQDAAMVLRWAPTGGDLGSPQAYLLVEGMDGLCDGAYFYDPAEHQLALVAPFDTGARVSRLRAKLPPVPAGGCLLVLTAALDRITQKYQALGLRLCLLDAGVAMAQARAVAHACGLATTPVDTWDESAVAAILGIDPEIEPVTAIATILWRLP